MESHVRLGRRPDRSRSRFVHNKDFLDALDYNRIVLRAEGRDEGVLDEWADLYELKGKNDELVQDRR
jgi:hypothetical protein